MLIPFHPSVDVLFSTKQDGSMANHEHATQHVDTFLSSKEFALDRNTIYVTYGEQNTYTEAVYVDGAQIGKVTCDALYTDTPGHVLVLPVADCIGTVVYDPETSMLGILHLGRHSSVAGLIESFAIDVADALGSDPRDWHVWMSPSLRSTHDLLDYFDPADTEEWAPFVSRVGTKYAIDTVGHNTSRLLRIGVKHANIHIDPRDTYLDDDLYSHRAAMELGDDTKQGRMIVAARIK